MFISDEPIRDINQFSAAADLWWVKYMQNRAIPDFVGETDSPETFMNPSGCFQGVHRQDAKAYKHGKAG